MKISATTIRALVTAYEGRTPIAFSRNGRAFTCIDARDSSDKVVFDTHKASFVFASGADRFELHLHAGWMRNRPGSTRMVVRVFFGPGQHDSSPVFGGDADTAAGNEMAADFGDAPRWPQLRPAIEAALAALTAEAKVARRT
jgi:hypothetical protein